MSTLSPHSSLLDLLKANQQGTPTNTSNNNNNNNWKEDDIRNHDDISHNKRNTNEEMKNFGRASNMAGVPSNIPHTAAPAVATNTAATAHAVPSAGVARVLHSPNRPSQKMHRRRTTGDVSQEERNSYYASMQLQQCASGPMSPATMTSRVYSFEPLEQLSHHSQAWQQRQTQTYTQPQTQQQSASLSKHDGYHYNSVMEKSNQHPVLVGDVTHISRQGSPSRAAEGATIITHGYLHAQYDPLFNQGGNSSSKHNNNNNDNNNNNKEEVASDHLNPKNRSEMSGKGHRQSMTLDTASLADIAAQLAMLKPQKQQSQQQPQLQTSSNHLITLGNDPSDSTGTKKSHRRFKSQPFGRKSMTMADSFIMSLDVSNHINNNNNNISHNYTNEMDHKKDEKESQGHRRSFSAGLAAVFRRDDNDGEKDRQRSVTPVGFRGAKDKKVGSGSHKKDDVGCKDRPTTPVEKGKGSKGIGIFSRGTDIKIGGAGEGQENVVVDDNVSPSRMMEDFSPAKMEIKLRSSEQDPSPHQVTIPSVHDVLYPARLCEALMQYRAIDQNFDYGSLVGMPRAQMNNFLLMIESSSPSRNKASTDSLRPSSPIGKQASTPKGASARQHLMEVHVPIIKFLANADDLILEGFFHEICDHTKGNSFDTTSDMSTRDRMEVAIFKSDARRQFFVIYQGCSETQDKPVKKGEHKDGIDRRFTLGRKEDDHRFSEEQPVVVFPPFRRAYFNSEIEKQVFTTLDSLAERHPFFDVVITGHSFGGVMALLSSMRYANIRSAIMVSCYAFGCPKIGNIDFRYYVNSLPNLRVSFQMAF